MQHDLSPAKLNLFLAITGQRPDGYHNLLSLMVPLPWGDRISIVPDDSRTSLSITGPFAKGVPTDANNLILKAINKFRSKADIGHFKIHLEKNIPHGAGLGGGSSNAACTLLALNEQTNQCLSADNLFSMAAQLGSDVPFFLRKEAQIIRGRGENTEPIDPVFESALQEWHFAIMRPPFAIETAEAYSAMRANPEYYVSEEIAAEKLQACLQSLKTDRFLPFNNFEGPLFKKFSIYSLIKEALSAYPEISFSLTGSGSACFIATKNSLLITKAQEIAKKLIGSNFFGLGFRICVIPIPS
jgi:4-diphosphocytidyl-2-C-methyl-D-erythritol kinase